MPLTSGTQLLLLVAVFAIIGVVTFAAMTMLMPTSVHRRLDKLQSDDQIPSNAQAPDAEWVEKIAQASRPFAKLSLPKEGWEKSALRTRFTHAGWRSPSAPGLYFAAKTVLMVGMVLVPLLSAGSYLAGEHSYVLMALVLALAAIGYYLPNVVLVYAIRRRQRAIFEDFPDALDLLTVCIEAGLGMDAAIVKVSEEIHIKSPKLSEEFQLLTLELRAGMSRDDALRNMAMRTGVEELNVLVAMLIQAQRFGTSVGDSLRVHSENLRLKRRLRAEEAAGKIAVKLLFPLIFCIFPSLLLVLLGPAFIQILRVLLPALSQTGGGAPL
ncbi:Flp pilus assembly protein TadC [Paraburkholderia piptadeniae]|uniref:Flp pilus assembly protein TadC n=1 Tax=Paraburkholderia piptadeniae TaxID=1701573 RepID=A0A1N7SET4_9BURK|nr:type II secretion system F family protein [Paraburkholderia piptadeniae]SIT45903.1 Flp pilus assembly protein TadC [Paraburkholderia piptadeniae]